MDRRGRGGRRARQGAAASWSGHAAVSPRRCWSAAREGGRGPGGERGVWSTSAWASRSAPVGVSATYHLGIQWIGQRDRHSHGRARRLPPGQVPLAWQFGSTPGDDGSRLDLNHRRHARRFNRGSGAGAPAMGSTWAMRRTAAAAPVGTGLSQIQAGRQHPSWRARGS